MIYKTLHRKHKNEH